MSFRANIQRVWCWYGSPRKSGTVIQQLASLAGAENGILGTSQNSTPLMLCPDMGQGTDFSPLPCCPTIIRTHPLIISYCWETHGASCSNPGCSCVNGWVEEEGGCALNVRQAQMVITSKKKKTSHFWGSQGSQKYSMVNVTNSVSTNVNLLRPTHSAWLSRNQILYPLLFLIKICKVLLKN